MEFLRRLRWVLYPTVSIFFLLFGAYCSFPTNVLLELAESSITNAVVGMNPKAQSVPKVSIKNISLWRGPGLDMEKVLISWPTPKSGLPLSINIDSLQAKLGLFSLISSTKNFYAQAELYQGIFESDISLKSSSLNKLHIGLQDINFGKMSFVESTLGAPLAGLLGGSVLLDGKGDMLKEGTGSVDITIKKAVFGPGKIKLPSLDFMSEINVPQITLGDFNASMTLDKGQLVSKTISFANGDLQGELKLTISLAKQAAASRLDGTGWFSLKKEFIEANETIKMLFELLPELSEAYRGDGRVNFSLRGSVKNPKFSLATR